MAFVRRKAKGPADPGFEPLTDDELASRVDAELYISQGASSGGEVSLSTSSTAVAAAPANSIVFDHEFAAGVVANAERAAEGVVAF